MITLLFIFLIKNEFMRRLSSFLIFLLLILSCSCEQKVNEKETFVPVFSTYKSDSASIAGPESRYVIYYGVLTPVEICEIFNRLGVSFDINALNPVSNSDEYLSSSKAALNEGVYGVDFGYLKMFGVGQEMIKYMVTIRNMSNKLGIYNTTYTADTERHVGTRYHYTVNEYGLYQDRKPSSGKWQREYSGTDGNGWLD